MVYEYSKSFDFRRNASDATRILLVIINIATSCRIAKTASTTMLKIAKRAFLSQMAILASVLGSTGMGFYLCVLYRCVECYQCG